MITISNPSEFKSSDIPLDPGVYLFKDAKGEILCVGKAKSLRARVRSYFYDVNQPVKTRRLVSKIRGIDWIVVNNDVEALLLENRLVKQHTPRYNINLKDAKTFAYIALTREPFPRVYTSRKVSPKLETFGPYTDGYMRQRLQRLVIRIFKLRVCREFPKRACLNYHIGLCSAPCTGNITEEKYNMQVNQARSLLKGNYKQTIHHLTSQMQNASETKQYEQAIELRNQIAAIQLVGQRQIVDNERRYDQDVLAFRQLGEKVMVVQMRVRRGVLLGKKEFKVDLQSNVEQEFLKVFYGSTRIPREILLNKPCWLDADEKSALEEFFASKRGASVRLSVPKRGDRHLLVELAEKNVESTLNENSVLVDLQTLLGLATPPHVIECFDVSNLGKEHAVSGMVRFMDAKPDKSNYRKFKMKTTTGQDDFAGMNEAVHRRYKRLIEEKQPLPDLVVVDGGLGQVHAAQVALQSLGLQLPVIGLAKEREELYLPGQQMPRRFDKNSRMMLLLRQMRDAAHDFSVGYNRKRRQMQVRDEFKKK